VYGYCVKTFNPTAIVQTVYGGPLIGSIFQTPAVVTRLFVARKLIITCDDYNMVDPTVQEVYMNTTSDEANWLILMNGSLSSAVGVAVLNNMVTVENVYFFSLDGLTSAFTMWFDGYRFTIP
jgi:hypothetical protein